MTEGVADIGSAEADLDPSTERYAKRFAGPTGTWLLSRQTSALRDLIAPWPGARVLDVGGGHGQVAAPLAEDGHTVVVHASSDRALGRVPDLPGVETAIGSLTGLPYPDDSFDVVTSFRILAHIGNWAPFVAELCRVSRHAVIVDFPIPGGANALEPLLFGMKKRIEGDTRRYQTMSRPDVRRAFIRAGFPAIQSVGQFVLPMVLHRKLQRPSFSQALERGFGAIGLDAALGTPVVMRAAAQSPPAN